MREGFRSGKTRPIPRLSELAAFRGSLLDGAGDTYRSCTLAGRVLARDLSA